MCKHTRHPLLPRHTGKRSTSFSWNPYNTSYINKNWKCEGVVMMMMIVFFSSSFAQILFLADYEWAHVVLYSRVPGGEIWQEWGDVKKIYIYTQNIVFLYIHHPTLHIICTHIFFVVIKCFIESLKVFRKMHWILWWCDDVTSQ